MRKLSDAFMADLLGKDDKLKAFLELVKRDHTLDLEIRNDSINIYYRGGSIALIEREEDTGKYSHSFDNKNYDKDKKYFKDKCEFTVDNFPQRKQAMDDFFARNNKSEREFQQLIVRENNYSNITSGTDYFIADIEYAEDDSRSDMIAIKWDSESQEKKYQKNLELALVEVKYGDKALNNKTSGMKAHLKKANAIDIEKLHDDMLVNFNQKIKLGLIPDLKKNNGKDLNTIKSLSKEKRIDFIFILINHDPASKVLRTELENIDENNYQNLRIKVAVSNFMGYGLYKENVYSLQDFKEKFKYTI